MTRRIDRVHETRPAPTPFSRIIDRAYGLAQPHMSTPRRGLALPFGIEQAATMRWRVSADVRDVLMMEWSWQQLTAPVQTLLGVEIVVDDDAPDGTLELQEKVEPL